ncbi:hypothetical protein [Natrinema sp. DC36]|uniref:hypothetical protein n=1 Tax=Natrinema sp. DC36 TaxID=2878680 RepID=UPI001CEFB327|nr:hypothetical protein [Natrinema sp. DC36]
MSKAANNSDSGTAPTVNGHALDSVQGIIHAFSYLGEEYNKGDIYEISTLHGRDAVAIESRTSRFQHMDKILAVHGRDVLISDITSLSDGRLKIEIVEE